MAGKVLGLGSKCLAGRHMRKGRGLRQVVARKVSQFCVVSNVYRSRAIVLLTDVL